MLSACKPDNTSDILYDEATVLPFTKNKSSFYPSFSFFLFLISAKNPFVFADGLVVVLPATDGTVLFLGTVVFKVDFADTFGPDLFPLMFPFIWDVLKYSDESSFSLLGI